MPNRIFAASLVLALSLAAALPALADPFVVNHGGYIRLVSPHPAR